MKFVERIRPTIENEKDFVKKGQLLYDASCKEFFKRGVFDDDLLKFKSSYEANVIHALSSVKGKGTMLAAYQTLGNRPNYLV